MGEVGAGGDLGRLTLDRPADLYALYRRARAEQPVFYAPSMDAWVATRYDDVLTVLRDGERFSKPPDAPLVPLVPEAAAIVAQMGLVPTFGANPPDHTRIRRHINRAFTAQRVNHMEPLVRRIADELVSGFAAEGGAEIVGAYCFPLPARVIFEMMGVPEPDLDMVGNRWSRAFVELFFTDIAPDRQVECARDNLDYWNYCVALVEARREHPRDDLVSALLAAPVEGDPLSTAEIVSLCEVMVVAGHENTTKMIGNTLLFLLEDRSRWEQVVDDPARVGAVVEEALRYEAPVNGLWYEATREVELGGASIPRGARVFASYASANHDERHFPDPETWDPDRRGESKHLAFGAGPHSCFGASLARLTGRVAIEVLVSRLPSLRLEDQELQYVPMFVARGLELLHVAWAP